MSQKVLIAGASSGLGKKLAELYAAEGCTVGIIGRREELLKELQLQFPDNIHILKADIGNPAIRESINALIGAMKGMDTMIITASVVEFNETMALQPELDTLSTNVNGFVTLLNIAWQYFKEKGSGHIVAVTSVAASRGNKTAPAYNASKAFQSAYLEGLRVKAKHEKNNIRITELVPGYIDTAMGKGERLFWVASVEKAARQSKAAIRRKKARAFITKRWWLVYQLQSFLPIFIYDRLVNGSWKLKRKT